MVTSINDPIVSFRDLLQNKWDNTNTSISSDPTITSGWWDRKNDHPQVTLSGKEESPVGGGTTGYDGVESGVGPVQTIRGTLFADCWANKASTSVNPKKLTYEFAHEVRRILQSNAEATASEISDLATVSYLGVNQLPEITESPVLYRKQVTIGYTYYSFP